MRCPKCRKKVHKDDIYCIWCGASLRGRSPDDPWNCICADEQTHKAHRPRKQTSRRPGQKILFAILLALLLGLLPTVMTGLFFAAESLVAEFHTLTAAPQPEPKIIPPEDAIELDTILAQWEGFTVTANYIAMDEATGELELVYTVENRTDHTVITPDTTIMTEGYILPQMLYIQTAPGKTETHHLWIDTAPLQAVDVTRLRELTVSLSLRELEDYALLAATGPVTLDLDFDLPQISMHKGKTTLIETEDLTVTLVGHQPNTAYGDLILYTLIENHSHEPGSVLMEDARCGETDLHLFSYYDVFPGDKLLCRDMLYDIPYSQTDPTEISFLIRTEDAQYDTTATGETVIRLDPGGGSGSVRSQWE